MNRYEPVPQPSSEPAPRASESPSAWALLRVFRHRNYRLFFSGQLVSLMGTWITQVAQGWLVYDLSHSPLLLGITSFAGQVPVFFITSFGGMVADRVDRRRTLMVTQSLAMLQAATLAILTLSGVIQVWEVVALALFKGVVNAFDVPTRQAFIVDMVGREDLRNAISLNSIMFNLARVIGPSLAGVIIAVWGTGVCFSVDAISYAAVLFGIFLMIVPARQKRVAGKPFTELRDGFRYAWNSHTIRVTLLLVSVLAACGASYVSQMPAVAREVLHQGAGGLGALMASIGIGALFGAYGLARVPDRHLLLTPVLSSVSFGLSLIAFSQSHLLWLSMLLLMPAGCSLVLLGGAANTIIQTVSDDHVRGRIVALYTMSFMGMMPWGSLALGWLADEIGVDRAIGLGGVLCVLAAIAAYYGRGPRYTLTPPAAS
ncbi:MAG: MFS transporter [Alphaproteobacteria bacterium]|nr:MFS transporter [Alphaproteobacteria bacterium]